VIESQSRKTLLSANNHLLKVFIFLDNFAKSAFANFLTTEPVKLQATMDLLQLKIKRIEKTLELMIKISDFLKHTVQLNCILHSSLNEGS
jgi:hypothetical protein